MEKSGLILGLLVILAIGLELGQTDRCLTMLPEVNPKRVVRLEGQSLAITLEINRRTSQRLVTRIMKIFLVEALGYPGINLLEREDSFDAYSVLARMSYQSPYDGTYRMPETMVNMEVWIPPQEDILGLVNRHDVKECGSVSSPGSFGWFVPEALSTPEDNWRSFAKPETASRFASITAENWQRISYLTIDRRSGLHYCQADYCQQGIYIPDRCRDLEDDDNNKCATLLAGYPEYTDFVREHIDVLELYVKVIWFGSNLRRVLHLLTPELLNNSYNNNNNGTNKRSLVLIDWTPSTVVPSEIEFIPLEFPKCGNSRYSFSELGCRYESNRLVKLAWNKLELIANLAFQAINKARFAIKDYENLLKMYNNYVDASSSGGEEAAAIEETVACTWLKENVELVMREWMPPKREEEDKRSLLVGGIFPMSGNAWYTAQSIILAAKMAKEAINLNSSLLRDYHLTLDASNGQCKSDMVMKAFIDYIFYNYYERLVGILGPACSETVEPLGGISKLYHTVIISYSAEGSIFEDRKRFPYFFRTIGENKQYTHVYLNLFKSFGWKRLAALSEDGQKYTEYISHMQEILRDNGINFIANIKFPRERRTDEMTKYLEELKEKRARIIIADVYDAAARQVMCEAYKLEMTASYGYVWFLPVWLQPRWYDTDFYNSRSSSSSNNNEAGGEEGEEGRGETVDCTTLEMSRAIEGHFGITHAYFARDEDIMQEGITVRQWRERYERICEEIGQTPSNHAGYAYDAMWTYAYAVDLLLKENQSYVFQLHSNHTVNRLTEIIASTDFNGVSGRIKFYGGGPSRFSVITIVQRISDNETRTVGSFYPNISEELDKVPVGGYLELNKSAIVWLSASGGVPEDGSEGPVRCVLAGLAELLDVTCEVAIVIANIIGFGLLGALLITAFIIVKKKYEEKVRQHEKVMESFGLDPRQASCGLDKWEIPRDRVVINRKLGEGAFGTVYGGEAFFPEKGWLAVAVKTLKPGSTTEEKLDFLSEVEVMKRFEHKNMIKLLGVCIKCAPVLTVMEFMLYGDLKTYLLARRHLVNDRSYEDSDEISNKKLTAMALDVARALSYLAQLKYVHRDVASRNCLVNATRIVKLGDFGMTRPMYENDYYKFSRKGMLPVRWMAPESLGLGIFSPASDVWSYGVLLYEIITFGSFPFQGMSNNEVLAYVKAGNSLVVPKGVKPQLKGLIRSCWAVNHTDRPTAPEIVDFLATNSRVVSPCLDVPLASVQTDNTDQMDFQLSESIRNFSMSLSWGSSSPPAADHQQEQRPNAAAAAAAAPLSDFISDESYQQQQQSPLLDIDETLMLPPNNETMSQMILAARNSEQDASLLPLLAAKSHGPPSNSLVQQQQQRQQPRYVNLQPGGE